MNREEFYAEVPPIKREDIPLVAPAIFRTKMAGDEDGRSIAVACCLLLRGMGGLALRFRIVQCYAMVGEALRPAIIAYSGWSHLDFEEQVAFAGDCVREKMCEFLTQDGESP